MGLLDKLARRLRGPRCPVEPTQRIWVERRLLWLLEEFGPDPLRRDPLAPGSTYLPDSWEGSEDDCLDLVDQLCAFMQIGRETLDVELYDSEENSARHLLPVHEWTHSGPAGLFQSGSIQGRFTLGIDVAGLGDPRSLAATICHELGHVHLLGHGHLDPEAEDQERVTDLLTVFFGAGIFTANSAFQFSQWQDGQMQGWSARRLGYLTEREFGYALACYARLRGERQPEWASFLDENIRYFLDESAFFLERTAETSVPFGVSS